MRGWNKCKLNCYFINFTPKFFSTIDAETKKPLVDVIVGCSGQKGTEKHNKIARKKLKVKSKAAYIKQLESDRYAGEIVVYAQSFAVMLQASSEICWNLPLGTVARIWREGCIVRSQFLDFITKAFSKNSGNLLLTKDFATMMNENHCALREPFAEAARSAARNYFDSYRQSRGTANLM